MKINKYLVDENEWGLKCPHEMTPKYITVHEAVENTAAFNLISWMRKFYSPVSFHYAVDDVFVWQGIEDTRTAFHCGDGAYGKGNNESIGIEICWALDSDTEKYEKAKKNAAKLIGYLMRKYNIPIENVVQHNFWSGEDCPKRLKAEKKWGDFIARCKKSFDCQKAGGIRYESR